MEQAEGPKPQENPIFSHEFVRLVAQESVLGEHKSLFGPLNTIDALRTEVQHRIERLKKERDTHPGLEYPEFFAAVLDTWNDKISSMSPTTLLPQLQFSPEEGRQELERLKEDDFIKERHGIEPSVFAIKFLVFDTTLRQKGFFLDTLDEERSIARKAAVSLNQAETKPAIEDSDLLADIYLGIRGSLLLGYGSFAEELLPVLRSAGDYGKIIEGFFFEMRYNPNKKRILEEVTNTVEKYVQYKEASALFLDTKMSPEERQRLIMGETGIKFLANDVGFSSQTAAALVREGNDPLGFNYAFLLGFEIARGRYADACKFYGKMDDQK